MSTQIYIPRISNYMIEKNCKNVVNNEKWDPEMNMNVLMENFIKTYLILFSLSCFFKTNGIISKGKNKFVQKIFSKLKFNKILADEQQFCFEYRTDFHIKVYTKIPMH